MTDGEHEVVAEKSSTDRVLLVEKVLMLGLKGLPFGLVPSGILYWAYLRQIGRLDLLLPGISDPAGLGVFMFGFVVLSLATVITLVSPSMMVVNIVAIIEDDKVTKGRFLPYLPKILLWMCAGYSLWAVLAFRWSVILLIGPFIGAVTYWGWLYHRNHADFEKLFRREGDSNWESLLGSAVGITIFVYLAGLASVFPIYLLLSLMHIQWTEWWANAGLAVIAILVPAFSLLPGYGYCAARRDGKSLQQSITMLLLGIVIVVSAFVMAAPAVLDELLESAARAIGIRDVAPHSYLIKSDRFKSAMFDSVKWNTAANQDGVFDITAFTPLSLGSQVLLCPSVLADSKLLHERSASDCALLRRDEIIWAPRNSKEPVKEDD